MDLLDVFGHIGLKTNANTSPLHFTSSKLWIVNVILIKLNVKSEEHRTCIDCQKFVIVISYFLKRDGLMKVGSMLKYCSEANRFNY